MTFSIVGLCEKTKMAGVAITTSSIAVGSRCPWVRSKVGAVTTQNVTDPSIGKDVLDLLQEGHSSDEAIKITLKSRKFIEYRQVAVVDINGNTASFTGKNILGNHAVAEGKNCIAAGNLLKKETLAETMIKSFENNQFMHLADRLLIALKDGIDHGGEEGPTHSAAILVSDEEKWPLVDLRVDWNDDCPVEKLIDLWKDFKPQMNDYLLRAKNPSKAPSYGVPGDK
tara:strand:- start:953 stop:1630 length:678 start_codon:yes stop_codon:yes gene_type:complete